MRALDIGLLIAIVFVLYEACNLIYNVHVYIH